MSAEAVPPAPKRWSGPDLWRQRVGNYIVEDVLALPDDAPRIELRDGVMIVVPSPTIGHLVLEKPFEIRLRIRDITQ